MIKITEEDNNVLCFEAEGTLTHEDYEQVLIPSLERIIREHGKARILLFMGESFGGWEPMAMWDDAKFGLQHRADFERCAVVGGPRWVEWASKIGALLISGEVKTFRTDELQHAKNWIKAPIQANAK